MCANQKMFNKIFPKKNKIDIAVDVKNYNFHFMSSNLKASKRNFFTLKNFSLNMVPEEFIYLYSYLFPAVFILVS